MTNALIGKVSLVVAGIIALFSVAVPFSTYAAITCSLTALPPVVWPGQPTVLRLSSTGAQVATVDNGVGNMPLNGDKQTQSLSGNTTFTASLSNASTSETTTCSVEVQVTQDPASGGGGGGGGGSGMQQLQSLMQTAAGLMQLQSALGGNNSANTSCNPVIQRCGCGQVPCRSGCCGGSNMFMCPCVNTTNNFTTQGFCSASNVCTAVSSGGGQGQLGGGQQGLGGGLQGLQSIMQGLQGLMGGGGGGSSGGGAFGAMPGGYCTQYYYVSVPSSNPCAIYQPSSSDLLGGSGIQSGIADDLLGALGGDTSSGVGVNVSDILAGGQTNQPQQTQTPGSTLAGEQTGQLQDSLVGDVRLGNAGATIFANLRQGLTEVAGFFGGSTFGGSSQSALSRLCSSRPWASNNFLGRLAPDNFFDGLCRRAGYQVGLVQETGGGPQPSTSFTSSQQAPVPVATTTGPYIPPEADIRAEPSSVRLGARTYVFWNSRGVSSCSVTGPSFTQNTLTGAGATVPITGPTTFTISCTAPDGTQVTDSVTVNLAI